jgi:hypothetical protein
MIAPEHSHDSVRGDQTTLVEAIWLLLRVIGSGLRGEALDLPVGLILIVVAEEGRPDTKSPRHRLDQALLRVGGLPVAQLLDGGVGDPLPSRLPDQGRDLGVAVGTAAGGMRSRDKPVHLVRQRAQRRCALRSVRSLTRHH